MTLAGEVFRSDGVIAAGKVNRAAALGRPREKRELSEQLELSTKEINTLSQELEKIAIASAHAKAEIEKMSQEMSAAQKKLRENRADLQQSQVAFESAKRQYEFQTSQKDFLK